ncbi:hypothetical protein QTP88_000215 [Uroleucon formosanum]
MEKMLTIVIGGYQNSHSEPAKAFYFQAELINKHITLEIPQCLTNSVKLLIDTGILRNPFLAENRIAIDYYSSKIFQINTDPLTLSSRSETIVPIASTRPEGTALVVHSQILQEENIRLGNVVNTVKQGKILAIAINTSEEFITIPPLNIEEIEFEEFRETSMLIAINTNEITEDTHHVGRIREATLYQELNEEESDSLWKVISEYPDIFQLEGDSFPSTDAIQHEIHLKEKAKPVNVRPHRLPYAHRQEIVRQMEELENQLGRSRYYTTLDLVSGYHQVSIKAEDRQKTAFSTDKGHYEFRGMPFGLSGAPSTFQRLMNTALTGINGTKAFVYLDDIIVYASDLKDHESILRDFLGLSGYYRRFIEGYSQTAKPLTALLNKDVPFEWSTECQRAFEMLKQKLVEAPVLQYPDFERPFILTTDASQFAIGSILSQGTPGQDRPIAYASRTLNKAEQAYSTTEKELLSIVWQPLTWLFNVKDPGSRFLRWRLKLAQYQYEVIYKTGKSNTNVDALSRIMEVKVVQTRSQQHSAGSLINLKLFHEYISDSECQNYRNARVQEVTGDLFTVLEEFHLLHCVSADLKLNQGIALEFRRKFGHLQNLKLQRPKKTEVAYFQLGLRYIINLTQKQSVAKLDKQQIINEHHLAVLGGHRRVNQTVKRIQKQFDWEGLSQDVAEFISKCSSCQMNKTSSRNTKQPMVISTTASEPFLKSIYRCSWSTHSNLSRKCIHPLTLQCDLTKFSVATPMANKEANMVAYHFVTSFVCIRGIPQNLISDQGTEFLNKIFSETCKLIGVKRINTSPYHPQANGALARSHRTLGEYLRHYVDADQQNLDTYIPYAITLITNKTRYNYDDYQEELKQRLREAHRIARERLMKNKIKTKASYDQTSNPITIHFNDRVLIQDKTTNGKLSPKWLVATVPLNMQAESITQLPESLNTFTDHTGMYYEFREHIKLTNTDWNLITFVDLSNFNSKFQLLRSTYKATAEVCTDLQYKDNVTEFWHPCKKFDQSINTYSFEIEANLDNIWTTIGQDTSAEGRVRRCFGTSLTKLELKAIQLTLPAGTQLPIEPKVQNVPEFFSISSVSILQKDFLLVFALHFPIITVNSYDMYHPIPLPFFMKEDNAAIIEAEIDYISFSDDSEFYFILTQQQSDSCTRLTLYTICKGNEPIQLRASSKICEVEILKHPQFLPISCKSKYIKLDTGASE